MNYYFIHLCDNEYTQSITILFICDNKYIPSITILFISVTINIYNQLLYYSSLWQWIHTINKTTIGLWYNVCACVYVCDYLGSQLVWFAALAFLTVGCIQAVCDLLNFDCSLGHGVLWGLVGRTIMIHLWTNKQNIHFIFHIKGDTTSHQILYFIIEKYCRHSLGKLRSTVTK